MVVDIPLVGMMGKYIVGAWMDKWFKNYAKIKVRSSSCLLYTSDAADD